MTHPDPRVNDLLRLFPPPPGPPGRHPALGEDWSQIETVSTDRFPIERPLPWWRRALLTLKGTTR